MLRYPGWMMALGASALFVVIGTRRLHRLTCGPRTAADPGRVGPVPKVGGVALIGSVLLGVLIQVDLAPRLGAFVLVAAGLAAVGLLYESGGLRARYLLLAQVIAAGTVVGLGLRLGASGVEGIDVATTMAWIVALTSALWLFASMPRLAAGSAAASAIGVLVVAILGGEPVIATVSGAVVGGSVASLLSGHRGAQTGIGQAGGLFLGFVLAVLAIDVAHGQAAPLRQAAPMLLMALPILDTTVVALGRLRRGQPVSVDRADHLFDRLLASGSRPRMAALMLVAAQGSVVYGAVLALLQVRSATLATLVAAVAMGALLVRALTAQVHEGPVLGLPRRLRLAVLGLVAAASVSASPAVYALAQARAPAGAGAVAMRQGLDALAAGDHVGSGDKMEEANRSFAQAEQHLDGPFVAMGLAIPLLSSNLEASRALVSTGRRLAATGGRLARVSEGGALGLHNGSVDIGELRTFAEDLSGAASAIERAEKRLAAVQQSLLLPPLRRAVDELDARIAKQASTLIRAAEASRLLPAILGDGGVRRYFLAFQNNAEVRGSGGFVGNWGELVADNGRVEVGRFGRINELNEVNSHSRVLHMPMEFKRRWVDFQPQLFWQQVNISPDFPTTARVIADLYPQSGGQPVDGVIAIDPVGLSALLELTGPVSVPKWPEPITAGNVVDVTLKSVYERFPVESERVQFLDDLSRKVTQAFTNGELGSPARLVQVLSGVVRNGHLSVHLTNPDEQRLVRSLRADGAVPDVRGDSVLVVNQNVGGNKVDYYLRRSLEYDVFLDPDRRPASITGRIEVTLQNNAPAEGLPASVIGPYDNRFTAGENRTYLSVYTPFDTQSATLEEHPLKMRSDPDLDRQAHSAIVGIPSLSTRTVVVEVRGEIQMTPKGWYRLDVAHQPSLVPDDVEVSVAVAPGWRVAETRGAEPVGARGAAVRIQAEHQHTVWVRIERESRWARARDRLLQSP